MLLVLTTACATRAPEAPAFAGLEVPERFVAAESAPAAEAAESEADLWWSTFEDPALADLIEETLEHNQDLRAAAAAVEAALARARVAGAAREPQVGGSLSGSRREQIFVGLPIPGSNGILSSTSTTWSAGLSASWEADLWGRLRAGERAALGDAAAAAEDHRAARHSLAAQTAKAWFALIEAAEQERLAAATAESRRKSSERLASRYRQGLAPALDLRSARASTAQAERALEQSRRQLDAASRRLEVLLGRYPDAAVGAGAVLELPALPPAPPPGLPAELVARRPDLRAAEARLSASGYRVAEARAALYPGLSLTAGAGTTSDRIGDLLDGDFSVWNVAGSLLVPIFQGGRLRAGVELAEADRERRLAEYAGGILRAFAEVEGALAAEALLAAEEEALAEVVVQSRAARELAAERYRAGLGDFFRALDSERQAFAAESQLLVVRRLRLERRVDLHLALGGGFEIPDSRRQERSDETSMAEILSAERDEDER